MTESASPVVTARRRRFKLAWAQSDPHAHAVDPGTTRLVLINVRTYHPAGTRTRTYGPTTTPLLTHAPLVLQVYRQTQTDLPPRGFSHTHSLTDSPRWYSCTNVPPRWYSRTYQRTHHNAITHLGRIHDLVLDNETEEGGGGGGRGGENDSNA